MRLEDVTMVIRPRSDWEAVDSGLAMARRDFWRCWVLWWMAVFPVLLLIPVLAEYPVVWALVFFWCKLTGCRMILFQLSRRLFGENPGWSLLWRELPRALFRRFFYRMILARLSPWKTMAMPVEELEELRGGPFRRRMKVVMRRGEGMSVMLALMSVIGVFWLALGIFATSMLFVPETIKDEWSEQFSFEDRWVLPDGFAWLSVGGLAFASSLVDVFLTGAGFGLYVNSRTWVEGWDVELAFKRLANRLKGGVSLCLLAGVFWLGQTIVISAQQDDSEPMEEEFAEQEDAKVPKDVIQSIKQDPAFTIYKEKYKVPKTEPSVHSPGAAPLAGLAGAMSFVGMMMLAVILLALCALIAWLVYRARFLHRAGDGPAREKENVRLVMGMEVAAESLPADVLAAARRMWAAGSHLQAMSLLYRGALSWWIERAGVEIIESDTEGDCLRRVMQSDYAQAPYFAALTESWIRGAYAKELPGQSVWEDLCSRWPFAEGGRA